MASLYLDGKQMPEPALKGITVTKEKIWSKNAGRSSTGLFIGDIVAHKYKIQITWPPLTQAQTALIDEVISKASFEAKFIDPASTTGEFVTRIVYAGTPTYPVYSYANGLPRYVGVGVNLIER